MERLLKTFFECYRDESFKKQLREQKYICLPHYDMLMEQAPNFLKKEELELFLNDIKKLAGEYAKVLYDDVSHYCSMYDYRNTGADADWGTSRDSIERAIKFLTSREEM